MLSKFATKFQPQKIQSVGGKIVSATGLAFNSHGLVSRGKDLCGFSKIRRSYGNYNNGPGMFQKFERYISNLPRPLYQYILAINGGVFLMMNLPVFD